MELLILRHAEAVSQGFEGLSDADRPLTPRGLADAEALGVRLRAIDFIPTRICSSPLVRARETALAVLRGAQSQADIEFAAALAPGASTKSITEFLSWRVTRTGRILVVGHAPDLGALAGDLTGGSAMRLPPCGLARVDVDRPDVAWTGALVWLLTPEAIR